MKKVLIVDDSAFMRMLLKEKVSNLGQTEILQAANGKQAIETAKKQKPDLILLDLILPDINGETVLNNIRKAHIDSKVIMITAVGQKPVIERCQKLGISGYIVKPFDDTKITELIKKHMQHAVKTEHARAPAWFLLNTQNARASSLAYPTRIL